MSSMDDDADLLADLAALNEGDGTDLRQVHTVGNATRAARNTAWRGLERYVQGEGGQSKIHLLPAGITTVNQLLDPSAPHPDFPMLAGYMADWVAGAASHLASVPAFSSAKGRWRLLAVHYAEHKGQPFPPRTMRAMQHFIRYTMVAKGLITVIHRPRTLASLAGYQQLRDAAFTPNFSSHFTRRRFQIMFWMALSVQTSLRAGASFPSKHDPQNAACMTYSCFTLIVERNADLSPAAPNKIVLEYKPPRHKSRTTKRAIFTMVQSDEMWRCPISWFLTLAAIDGVLPCTSDTLFRGGENGVLGNLNRREFIFVGEDGEEVLCKTTVRNEVVGSRRVTWTAASVTCVLTELSSIAGFASNLTSHTFRRTSAIWARAAGATLKDVSLKLGHAFVETTARSYLGVVPAVDVGAAVFNTKGDYALALSLHPNVVRRLRDERDKLPLADRMKALSQEKIESALDACADLREDLLHLYGEIPRVPATELDELARRYAEWRDMYQHALSTSGHLAVLPDGVDVDYDAAAIAFLLSLEFASADYGEEEDTEDLVQAADHNDDTTGAEAEGSEQEFDLQIDPDLQDASESFDSAPTASFEDFAAAHQACLDLPDVATEITGYRPGETPIGGLCGACGQLLKAIVPSTSAVVNYRVACVRHVKHCHAQKSKESVTETLLAIFPRELERNPLVTVSAKGKTTNKQKKGLSLLVHDIYVRTGSFFKSKKDRINPLQCDFCQEELHSQSLVVGHMLSHDIWLPGAYRGERLQRLVDGEWDADLLWLPEPVYSYFDERYHPDPRELELFSQDYFQLRIVQRSLDAAPYGARSDMTFTAAELEAIKAHTESPSDDKYAFIAGERGRVVQEGLDLLQCHHELLRWTERIRPFCGPPSEQCEGQGSQLRWSFIEVIVYCRIQISMIGDTLPKFGPTRKPDLSGPVPATKFPLHRPVLIDGDDDLSCPDLVCRSAQLKFTSLLTLAWHLVGVHSYHLTTAPGLKNSAAKTLHDLCFTTEDEQQTFLQQTTGRFIRHPVASKYLKRRVRPIEGHHQKKTKVAEKKRKAKGGKSAGPSKKKAKKAAVADDHTDTEESESDESDA